MRTFLTVGAVAAAVLSGGVTFAQRAPRAPTDESMYISHEQLQKIMDTAPVSAATGKPGSFSARLFDGGSYSTAFIRLTEPDRPHAHGIWSEVFVVTAGSGILHTGGTITGDVTGDSAVHRSIFVESSGQPQTRPEAQNDPPPARRRPAGDLAGTAIEGGRKQHVKAGDVVLIPAGVAHTWIQIDEPVVYLDIKFPKAE